MTHEKPPAGLVEHLNLLADFFVTALDSLSDTNCSSNTKSKHLFSSDLLDARESLILGCVRQLGPHGELR